MKNIALLVLMTGLALSGYFLYKGKTQLKTGPLIANSYLYKDLIRVDSPAQNPKKDIESPVIISGIARGNWYFEASFPVEILDEDRTILGTGIAQAQGEWMTTDYVPFRGEIIFKKPKGKNGFMVFKKDNPSGLPEHDDSLEIPIKFEFE